MKKWHLEALGWTTAVAIGVGAAVLTTGTVDKPATQSQQVVVQEQAQPVVATVPTKAPVVAAAPTKAPVTHKMPAPAAARSQSVRASDGLGPPPGAFNDPVPGKTAAPEDRYALLMGVANYPAPTHDTVGGVNDIMMIKNVLIDNGWLSQNIKVLVEGQATGKAMRDGMAWLAQKGQPGTFSLFHYSGHVKQFGGGTEALWPYDRAFIKDVDVTKALQQVKGKMWVDIAGCEAASFFPGLPSSRVLVSGSSAANQKSYEYPKWGTSVWAGLLWGEALKSADANGDGKVVVGEALRYSKYYAQVITKDQRAYGRQVPADNGDVVRGWTLSNPPA